MMSLPDFAKHFFPDLPFMKNREMLQNVLRVTMYRGNSGHQEVLRSAGQCEIYDSVPLVLVMNVMTHASNKVHNCKLEE